VPPCSCARRASPARNPVVRAVDQEHASTNEAGKFTAPEYPPKLPRRASADLASQVSSRGIVVVFS
jgi:hypothetical protein